MIVLVCCFAYGAIAFAVGMCFVVGEYRRAARENGVPDLPPAIAGGALWPGALIYWAVLRVNDLAKALARVDELPEVKERKRQALERELGIGEEQAEVRLPSRFPFGPPTLGPPLGPSIEDARKAFPSARVVNMVERDGSTHVVRWPPE